MGTFLAVVGFFAFLGGIGYGVFSLIRKNHRAKKSFILAIIGIVVFLIGGSLVPEEPTHSNSEKTVKKESKKSKATTKKSSKTKSSESKVTKKGGSASSSNSDSSSSSEQVKDQDKILAEKLPKNVLHGYRDKSDSKENSMGGWVIKSRDYVRFWTNDKGIITSMKLDFRDVPLMANDPDNDEYITDNTAEDAVKTSDLGNNKYLYHSAKYNLSYQIDFQKNDDGDITLISIFPEQ
jgi:hypothetical protein